MRHLPQHQTVTKTKEFCGAYVTRSAYGTSIHHNAIHNILTTSHLSWGPEMTYVYVYNDMHESREPHGQTIAAPEQRPQSRPCRSKATAKAAAEQRPQSVACRWRMQNSMSCTNMAYAKQHVLQHARCHPSAWSSARAISADGELLEVLLIS
jgi:hypothetical protein